MSNKIRTLIVFGAMAALVGCSLPTSTGEEAPPADSPSESATAAERNSAVHARLVTDPSGFDPAIARAADDYYVGRLLYDTLLRRGDDGRLVPGLASSWTAESASDYVFQIRDDATCADGTQITSTVVADSLRRLADPETGSPVRTMIFGSEEVPEITADDEDGTVSISLEVPWSDFPAGTTAPHAGIVCPAGLEDPESLLAGDVEGAFSGPYILTESNPGVGYTFTLREDYVAWPEFEPRLEGVPATEINLQPATDQTTIANKLLAGEYDSANLIDSNAVRLEEADGFSTHTIASSTLYLILNQRDGSAAADPDFRKAIAQAIDNHAFTQAVTDGRGTPLTSIDAQAVPCVVDEASSALPKYDLEAAADVLDGTTIRLVGTTSLDKANEYVAEALRQTGAKVELESLDGATWATRTASGNSWDLTVQGSVNLIGTLPNALLRVMGPLTEDGGRNSAGANNPEGYESLQRAMEATDPAEQCQELQNAQASLLERVDIVPLSTLPATVVTKDGLTVRTFGDYLDPTTFRYVD